MTSKNNKLLFNFVDFLLLVGILALLAAGTGGYFWFSKKIKDLMTSNITLTLRNKEGLTSGPGALETALESVVKGKPIHEVNKQPAEVAVNSQPQALEISSSLVRDKVQDLSGATNPKKLLNELERKDKELFLVVMKECLLSNKDLKLRDDAITYLFARSDLIGFSSPMLKQVIAEILREAPSERRNRSLLFATHTLVNLTADPTLLKEDLLQLFREERDEGVLDAINRQYRDKFPKGGLLFTL